MKLEIGSGKAKFKNYTTVDKDPSVGADLCLDIEKLDYFLLNKYGILQKNSVDEIRAHHILEHLKPENKVKIMSLFWDLLKEGGILDIEVPLFPHPASVQDPTHLSFWTAESFWYFIKGNRFGEAFAKRHSEYKVPLFEKVDDWLRSDWAYGIKLKKVI